MLVKAGIFFYDVLMLSIRIETENSILVFNKFFYPDGSTFCLSYHYSDKKQAPRYLFRPTSELDIKELSYEEIEKLIVVELIKRKLR